MASARDGGAAGVVEMVNLVDELVRYVYYPAATLGAIVPLVAHAPDLWTVDHALNVGGFLPMGTRTTIVRLGDGRLLVHAPGKLDAADAAAIRALGPVAAVVAPNVLHHLFFDAARAAFPEAEGWAPAALAPKVQTPLTGVYDGRCGGPWTGTLELHKLDGAPRMDETVLYDPRSHTLVVTDLCFNIRRVDGWFARANLELLGAYGRFGPSWLCRNVYIGDRTAIRRSVDHLLAWDFDRVVLAHGDVVASGGREGLRAAFAWLP